jgi:hypothetical protein
VENELGLRQFLEERGHTYIVTDDKEGPDSELERHLPDADIVRARLFWHTPSPTRPACMHAAAQLTAPGASRAGPGKTGECWVPASCSGVHATAPFCCLCDLQVSSRGGIPAGAGKQALMQHPWSMNACGVALELHAGCMHAQDVCSMQRRTGMCAQVITTPFWPAYLTPERIAKAPKLKLALTAGIGSDHVDLPAASKAGITVAEVTGGRGSSASLGCLST